MKLSEFDYHLPKQLIAQHPMRPRDHSRLLVIKKEEAKFLQKVPCRRNLASKIEHKHFYNIIDYLRAGDVIVMNNSKVFPARLIGRKKVTGGKIEVFLHQKIRGNVWQCLLGGHGRKEGLEVEFTRGFKCNVIKNNQDGTWNVKFNLSTASTGPQQAGLIQVKGGKDLMKIIEKIGETPLPPYIKRTRDSSPTAQNDKSAYQTIYADKNKIGSVAAPTAGFHFTKKLITKLKKKGVQIEYVTLHVGLGTFAPVKADNIKKHKMHAEYVEVKKDVIEKIKKAKQEKRRIIAVGTTSVRTLEALWQKGCPLISSGHSFQEWVNIFIYPGYKFKVVDAMITNFHLPKSTLLMLVSAFAGKNNINRAYKEAINKKYRFCSYGDAMFIY